MVLVAKPTQMRDYMRKARHGENKERVSALVVISNVVTGKFYHSEHYFKTLGDCKIISHVRIQHRITNRLLPTFWIFFFFLSYHFRVPSKPTNDYSSQ